MAFLLPSAVQAGSSPGFININLQDRVYIDVPYYYTLNDLLYKLNLPSRNRDIALEDGQVIETGYKIVTVEEEIVLPYHVMAIFNENLPRGYEESTQGAAGLAIRNIIQFYDGDLLIGSYTQMRTVKYPTNAFTTIGTGKNLVVTPAGVFRYTSVIHVEATAYSAEQPNLSNYSAMGVRVRHGIVAVDPQVIPLGTYLYIPGYGLALAADTGGAIRGEKIDLAFETIQEALIFGRQFDVRVYVLDKRTDLF